MDDELSYQREYEHLTLARVLLAQHTAEHDRQAIGDAAALLDRLRTDAEAGDRTGSVVEILALRALVHHAAGDSRAATTILDEAMHKAEPEGFVRLFLDGGPPMIALLRLGAWRGTAAARAQRLLAAADAALAGQTDPTQPTAPGLVDPLSERELQVLRLLRSELSGPEIARELVVSLNTMRTHTKNIYMKLGVNSRRAAVRHAAELGL